MTMLENFCEKRGYTLKGAPFESTEGTLAHAFMFGPGIDVMVKCFKLERWAREAEQWMRAAASSGVHCVPQVIERAGRVLAYRRASGTSLLDWAESEPSEDRVVAVALACIEAVWSMVSRGICHGDLHSRNIIIDDTFGQADVVIIDAQTDRQGLLDDCDEMIESFCTAGFISRHQAAAAGAIRCRATNEDVVVRSLPKVAAVLAGVSPTLRRASREARRASECGSAPGRVEVF